MKYFWWVVQVISRGVEINTLWQVTWLAEEVGGRLYQEELVGAGWGGESIINMAHKVVICYSTVFMCCLI